MSVPKGKLSTPPPASAKRSPFAPTPAVVVVHMRILQPANKPLFVTAPVPQRHRSNVMKCAALMYPSANHTLLLDLAAPVTRDPTAGLFVARSRVQTSRALHASLPLVEVEARKGTIRATPDRLGQRLLIASAGCTNSGHYPQGQGCWRTGGPRTCRSRPHDEVRLQVIQGLYPNAIRRRAGQTSPQSLAPANAPSLTSLALCLLPLE
jgi:hypothetical protein